MFRILVADDTAFDRRLVTAILETAPDHHVTCATNGIDALEQLENESFDLLVTDLNMPELDGLELIRRVQHQHPELLTIVITAYGSEATAMRALQTGAYSYVPKFHIQDELLSVVASVRDVMACRKQEDELLCSVARHSLTLTLPNDLQRIKPTVDYLQKLASAMKIFDGARLMHLGSALKEGITNAIVHGNLEIEESTDSGIDDIVAARQKTSPYADRRVTIDVNLDAKSAVFTIRDEGCGFDLTQQNDPRDPANLLELTGRGITLMHTFADSVRYNDVGNEVTLRIDSRPAAPKPENIGSELCDRISNGDLADVRW